MPNRRIRLAAVTVQPMIMVDDGETLTPTPVNTVTVPAAQLNDLPDLLRAALAKLQDQLDAGETIPAGAD